MYKSQKVIIVAFYIHSPSWQVSCILFASNSDASVLEVEFVEGERTKTEFSLLPQPCFLEFHVVKREVNKKLVVLWDSR